MIRLGGKTFEEMMRHAEREYPRECCGLLVGRIVDGGRARIIQETFPVANVYAEEGERYHRMSIEPLDYARAERLYAARGLGVVGNYHSHPEHTAVPSRFDLEHLAPWPTMSYIVVSVRAGKAVELRSWELLADRSRFEEEEVTREEET